MSATVSQWLQDLGLGQYADNFVDNDIDWDLINDIDAETLKDIGIGSAGHRIRILKAIANLRPGSSEPGVQADTSTSPTGGDLDETEAYSWQRKAGERKPVTMLFADLVGSTALTESLDAEEAHELLYRAAQRMCQAVENNRGTVCRFMGDGVMAMFGAPLASERHALEACRAALEMQASIDAYADELDSNGGARVQIRVGLHSGEVVVLEVGDDPEQPEYDASGPTVPLAARMEQSAAAGTIQMTPQTRALAGVAIEASEGPAIEVKGFSEPIPVFRLERMLSDSESTAAATRRPITGRRSELAQFRGLMEASLEEQRGQCIHVRGDAGMGKTRLVEEMMHLAELRGFARHKALVLDFGAGKGQGAIPSLVKSLLDIDAGAGEETKKSLLDQAIDGELVDGDNRVFLNDLLDIGQPLDLKILYDAMDVEVRREGKQAALADILSRQVMRKPLLVVIEDLHWADAVTLDYLARTAALVATCPALMIFTSRIEGDPIDAGWRAQAEHIPVVTWDLGPLRREEALQLVSAYAGTEASLVDRCIERAAGNPLFLEQLLLSISTGGSERIPDSIKSLVLARLDQLPGAHKQALQAAAVLGQRFDLDGLRFLIGDTGYDCSDLIAHHLLRPEGPFLLFGHALIQEGAYDSLLKSQRVSLHRQAANWYDQRDSELYAVHLDHAGDATAAMAYLAAGREHLAQYRPDKALQLAQRGLAIASATDQFELICLKGEILRFSGATSESIEMFREACERAADDAERCRALVGLAEGLAVTEAHDELLQVMAAAETIASEKGLWLQLAITNQLRGGIHFFRGEHEQCLAVCQFALECAHKANSPEAIARALSGLADSRYCRGRFDSANRYYTECIELSRQHGLGRIIAANLSMRGFTFRFKNEPDAAIKDVHEAVALAVKTRNLRAEMVAGYAGLYLAQLGDLAEGERLLQRGFTLGQQLGSILLQAASQGALAKIALYRGQRVEALTMAREAIDILRASDAGMAFRGASTLGTLALATDDPQERASALSEGRSLLESDSMGHNHFYFCEDAIEACLQNGQWDATAWYINHLREYTSAEPLPYSDMIMARGEALVEFGRGCRSAGLKAKLEELRDEVNRVGLHMLAISLDEALAETFAAV